MHSNHHYSLLFTVIISLCIHREALDKIMQPCQALNIIFQDISHEMSLMSSPSKSHIMHLGFNVIIIVLWLNSICTRSDSVLNKTVHKFCMQTRLGVCMNACVFLPRFTVSLLIRRLPIRANSDKSVRPVRKKWSDSSIICEYPYWSLLWGLCQWML